MTARRKKGKRRVTIVDIAERLGLSPMTVSRAIRGGASVSEETRLKVIACAEELGYRPDRWARSLVTRTSGVIGVVVPDIAHLFFAEITSGVEEVLEPHGYDILLCHSRRNIQRETAEVEMLLGSRVDGLIVASEHPQDSPELYDRLEELEAPFVLVDRFFPKRQFLSVRVDDRAVGRIATEHLAGLGHRRIAFIEGTDVSVSSLRRQGYQEALKSRKLPSEKRWIATGQFDIESGRVAMRKLLEEQPRPTAVFAANDPMAIGAVYACREAGLRVPEDISVVGAGNIEGPHHPNPYLTTLDWPRQEMGRAAARLLIEAISSPQQRPAEPVLFQPKLLVRGTTAPCRP